MVRSLEQYSVYLEAEAKRMLSDIKSFRIPIGKISYQAGMLIERKENIRNHRALLAFPNSPTDWARVFLPKKNANHVFQEQASPYERFCVAHELAHVLLYRKYGIVPYKNAEYWNFEQICDDFARKILIPERSLWKIKPKEYDLVDWIDYVQNLSFETAVPEMHAARRVCELYTDLIFLNIKRTDAESYQIVTTTLIDRAGTNRKLGGIFALRLDSISRKTEYARRFQLSGHTLAISQGSKFNKNLMYDVTVKSSNKIGSDFILCLRKRRDLWV